MKHAPLLTSRCLGFRQVQVLGYVRDTIESEGQAPSYDMIRDALSFRDKVCVLRVVEGLERRGLLSRAGLGRVRRLRLVVNNNY